MSKFKIGDRVRVIGPDWGNGYTYACYGAEGVVVIDDSPSRPVVKFDKGEYENRDGDSAWYYEADQLIRVTEDNQQSQEDQWDTFVRGTKISSSKAKVIFKYQMPVLEKFTMKLPKGAEIIRVADQGGMFWLWAVVDTEVPDEERHFVAVKCGANVPDGNLTYIGFCAIFVQQELGLYIFEDKK